jgi:hypothetical protein
MQSAQALSATTPADGFSQSPAAAEPLVARTIAAAQNARRIE